MTDIKRKLGVEYRKNSWFPMPRLLGQVFTLLSHPALKLYLALTVRGSGYAKKFRVSNLDLMKAAGITREKTFRAARAELLRVGLIEATATDGPRRTYDYLIADPVIFSGEDKDTATAAAAADPGAVYAVPLPPEVMEAALNPEVKLHQD